MSASERRKQMKTSNKPKNIKYHNQKLILSMLRQTETLSVADIARRAKLSKTTINKVMNEFDAKDLVVMAGKGASSVVGGKKPERFAFNASYSHVIALTVGKDRILGALSDLKCKLLHQRSAECGLQVTYEQALAAMADMIQGLLADANLPPDRLCGIVLGCEGIIDADRGAIYYSMHHMWGGNLPLGADLARLLPFPVKIRVNNNVRLAGYAHLILNPDQYGTIVVISSAQSAGGCIIEAQELVHGDNGFVGEFGHMVLEPYSDVRCNCGGYGCFGALVTPELVLAAAYKRYAEYQRSAIYPAARDRLLDINDVFRAANAGDDFARSLLDRVLHYFSILIHNIVLLRDPAKVIIQGVYSRAGDYFLDTLRKKVAAFPFYKMERKLPISYSSITEFNPYLVGAVYFGVDEFLSGNGLYD